MPENNNSIFTTTVIACATCDKVIGYLPKPTDAKDIKELYIYCSMRCLRRSGRMVVKA